jgi:GAF domain-containing protein
MLARGHHLAIGGASMIGTCIATSTARIAADVRRESLWRPNPLLPATRSELALPLRSQGRVIGAMTIQSEQVGAFGGEDVTVLQTMADQLANAIEKMRLLERAEQTVQQLQAATGAYTRESWRAFAERQGGELGYRYRLLNVEPDAGLSPEAQRALEENRSVLEALSPERAGAEEASADRQLRSSLAVPIRLRDQVLGALSLRFADAEVPPETVQLVEQIAGRLALSLESARLLEETRQGAERERLVGEIVAGMRASLDVDEVIRSSVQQIRATLDLASVSIRMAPEPGEVD